MTSSKLVLTWQNVGEGGALLPRQAHCLSQVLPEGHVRSVWPSRHRELKGKQGRVQWGEGAAPSAPGQE